MLLLMKLWWISMPIIFRVQGYFVSIQEGGFFQTLETDFLLMWKRKAIFRMEELIFPFVSVETLHKYRCPRAINSSQPMQPAPIDILGILFLVKGNIWPVISHTPLLSWRNKVKRTDFKKSDCWSLCFVTFWGLHI